MNIDASIKQRLSDAHQSHLLDYWSELTEDQRRKLLEDINEIDFDRVRKAYHGIKQELIADQTIPNNEILDEDDEKRESIEDIMEPVPDAIIGSINQTSDEQLKIYHLKDNLQAISEGLVCVLLLAGGQGTRLGVDYPKGMYDVGLPSRKTLYQIQAERIRRLQQLANEEFQTTKSVVPWFIMTSEHTQEETEIYLRSNNYFGLKPENVILFEQHTLPALDFQGKILLAEKYKLTKAADGNGGLYRALKTRGILLEMEKRQIKYIHVYCVDNILVRLGDPIFVGFCIEKNANCAAKVVKKSFPNEAVGVICKVRDRYQVVEYSEISDRTAQKKKSENTDELLFNAGNICNHCFTLDFLQDVCQSHDDELRYHIAKKKIPSIDKNGQRVSKPKEINGMKLEKFVFDVFPFSKAFAVWEVHREDEFSPLKNGTGTKDTPETCRRDLILQHIRYLKQAGALLQEVNENCCEISPLVSYAGENLDFVNGQKLRFPIIIELNAETQKPEINTNKHCS
ncbi:unnamed protein product [Rotaria socialis]|uniref:UDP-N-acetylglucosamine diphosphorylase n=1 Tax=Rotaria socialis TaxID=392032 RepID=A0A817XHX3_9BILA|nr:unnamed protein product [Rotaria socialis]CAF3680601.1 unnamed protein product [Rotaria socialis]CAF4459998.1 unnamed protein product [Rotaria socialis]CAF4511471.1 unnamed protein product [Rotaria socialis]